GIRDFHVTGVQTCALPISAGGTKRGYHRSIADSISILIPPSHSGIYGLTLTMALCFPTVASLPSTLLQSSLGRAIHRRVSGWDRSEERRVGKERSARWRRK